MARSKKVEKVEIEEAIEEAASLQTGPSQKEKLEYERADLYELHTKLKELAINSIGDLENKIARVNSEIEKL